MEAGSSMNNAPRDHDIVLDLKNVAHWFGDNKVLYDLNLKVARGEIVSLVGPSGCGKSTLLRAILGTHPPCEGTILVNGRKVDRPSRDRGIVYQRYSLYPFLTARKNVALGPMLDETGILSRLIRFNQWRGRRKQHLAEAEELLARMGLGAATRKYPSELSGGMRQRVAVAQALIMKPEILLLDEPFGALDEATREELQEILLGLYRQNVIAVREGRRPPFTIFIVTHELNEALYVADRVIGLSQHWDWRGHGLSESPGATILYDAPAPVFEPEQTRDFTRFIGQREEIRSIVFEPEKPTARDSHLRFWDQIDAGKGEGVMAT